MATRRAVGPGTGLHESETVEFKESWVEDALCDLAAMANTAGGSLYIGVNRQGQVVADVDVSDETQQSIAGKIRNHLHVGCTIRTQELGGFSYVQIDVRRASAPVLLRGVHWSREGTVSVRTEREDWGRHALAHLGISWDTMAADASVEEHIDEERVRSFVRSALGRERRRTPERLRETDPLSILLRNLNLLSNGTPTNAAILLFGKNPQAFFRSARVRVLYLRATNDVVEFPDCTGPILEQIEAAMVAVRVGDPARTTFGASPSGTSDDALRRHESVEYPDLALREAITNAVVHRDYTRIGTEVLIKMYADRITIWNPGGLIGGLTLDMLSQDPHPSERRNPLIAETCYVDHVVERYGSGTIRMIEACQRAGISAPEFSSDSAGFTVTLRKNALTPERLARQGLNERQIAAVQYARAHRTITNAQYVKETGASRPTATRDLEDLVQRKVFVKHGARGAGTYYTLALPPAMVTPTD
jgi:ATP-dependent DNA helicase RecG